LIVNTTVFYIDWQTYRRRFPLACGYPFVVNKGKIKSEGVEFEGHAKVTEALTADLSGSYTDARANGALTNLGAPDGARAPYFPKTIISAGGDIWRTCRSAVCDGRPMYTYRSSAYTQFNERSPLSRKIPSSSC